MKKKLFITFTLAAILFSACQNRKISKDEFIQITHKKGPVAANRGPATILKIVRENNSFRFSLTEHHTFISKEDGSEKEKNILLETKLVSPRQVDSLITLLNTSRFMSLKAKYRNPDILDGDVESLTLELTDTKKQVVAVNRKIERFNSIVDYLRGIAKTKP